MTTTVNPAAADTPTLPPRSWRKRHPVLSRLMLYLLGAGMVALLTVMLMDRKAEDAAAQRLARQKELENLPTLLMGMDPQGGALLDQLEASFPEATLEPELRGLRHRVKAMALRGGGKNDEARIELEAAEALVANDKQAIALALEFAEFELQTNEIDAAVARLEAIQPKLRPGGPAVILREALLAQAKCRRGTGVEGVAELRGLLERLPAPAGRTPTFEASGQTWTPIDAIEAATALVTRMDPESIPGLRARLVQHASADIQRLIDFAIRFTQQDDHPSAHSALRAAEALNPAEVEARAQVDPSFRKILENRENALK